MRMRREIKINRGKNIYRSLREIDKERKNWIMREYDLKKKKTELGREAEENFRNARKNKLT